MPFLRKYNTALSGGTRIPVPVRLPDGTLATSAGYTPATGDSKVSIDGGAEANTGSALAWDDGTLYLTLSGAETSGKTIVVRIIDPDAAIQDEEVVVETFGHASAMYQPDYSAAVLPANTTQLAGQTVTAAAGVTFPTSVGTSTLTQAQVTGGAYALQTDASGYVKISEGTGTGQMFLSSGVPYATLANTAHGGNDSSLTLGLGMTAVTVTADFIGNIGGNLIGYVQGDVQGKVIGSGGSEINGVGAWVLDHSGLDIAPASTALSTTHWTPTRAEYLDNINVGAVASGANLSALSARVPAALVGGRMDASVGAMAANTLTASALATDAVGEIQSGLATATAVGNVQAAIDGLNNLSMTDVRDAVGLASANLDTQLGTIAASAALAETMLKVGTATIASQPFSNAIELSGLTISDEKTIEGAIVYFDGGINAGKRRQVMSFDTGSNTATLNHDIAAPDVGDSVILIVSPQDIVGDLIGRVVGLSSTSFQGEGVRGESGAILATSPALATAQDGITTLTNRLTDVRAEYLDNLSGGAVATEASLTPIASDAATAADQSTTAAGNTETILNRLGAFAGAGVNTVIGFFRALMSKIASTPSDVGGTFDPATDSVEAIREKADTLATSSDVSVTITPAVAQATQVDPNDIQLRVSQYSAPTIKFTCVDRLGEPIDLSGKTLIFVAATTDGITLTSVFTRTSAGGAITVTGDNDNEANVSLAQANTSTAYEELQFWLWNTTDNQLLAKGGLQIPPSLQA